MHLSTTADVSTVLQEKPDVVIVATGAGAKIPKMAGMNGDGVLTYEDVLLEKKAVGDHVLVLGGGEVGCEVALYLARRGKRVTILEMLHRLADRAELCTRNCLMEELPRAGVETVTDACVTLVSGRQVTCSNGGREMTMTGDTIVVAMGARPENSLYEELARTVANIHLIGDAKEPRQIMHAVSEGFWTAYAI